MARCNLSLPAMEKVTEEWTPTGVKSIFQLSVDSTPIRQRPTSAGAGLQYTAICGFGWRFSTRVDRQSAPAVVVDDAGNTIDSFQLQLFFDPHLIRQGAYDAITLTTQVENLISVQEPLLQSPLQLSLPLRDRPTDTPSLGCYVYASTAPTPRISIMLTFSTTLGLTLPHALEPQMEQALEETLAGKQLADIKFYAFSRRGSEGVTHPLPLFAKGTLLQGFSDDLDSLLNAHGFSESVAADPDLHEPEERSFEDYGYDSDSDLESEADEEPAAAEGTSALDGNNESARKESDASPTGTGARARMGRVIVLKDTAFKTWRSLLYYLYTRRVNFRPLKSEGPKETTSIGPVCSPKSMYRLADKLGLEDLRALSLAAISSSISEKNLLYEVFSFFTSVYPAIQELEVEALTSNSSGNPVKGLKEMTDAICRGERPYCAETLFKIVCKIPGIGCSSLKAPAAVPELYQGDSYPEAEVAGPAQVVRRARRRDAR
ncbi:hypothetical protein K438DRAFT_1823872 [Mycena galopus ATCC 62051]|nr:hypothetical protein K438DRAFT_1823872 [Mycena galopus ATCC 62051]